LRTFALCGILFGSISGGAGGARALLCGPADASQAGGLDMKTIVYSEYGGPEVVRLADIDVPVPADDEILVKVHAAAVNPLDWHLTRGTPFPLRAMTGFRTPRKTQRLGADFAGMVAAVGRNVTQFRTGDAVFGGAMPFGSLAEYVTVRAGGLAFASTALRRRGRQRSASKSSGTWW
jgi:hypothetical protein